MGYPLKEKRGSSWPFRRRRIYDKAALVELDPSEFASTVATSNQKSTPTRHVESTRADLESRISSLEALHAGHAGEIDYHTARLAETETALAVLQAALAAMNE